MGNNDLSYAIIALDRSSQALDRIAAMYDKLYAKVEKLDGKSATVDVNIKSDKANASIDLLDTKFKKMTAGIITAAPLAGGAVIGGLGAAFIAVAALVEKSNAEGRASYKTLWQDAANETKAGAAQIIPQIVASGQILDAQMQQLGPQIKQAFAGAEPDVIALAHGVGDFATNIMPGATAAMQNSLPVFVGIETAAGRLGQTGGNALQSMSQHAQAYGRDVQSGAAIADGALTAGAGVVNALGETWAQNADGIDSSVTGLGETVSGVATGAVPALAQGLGVVVTAADGVVHVLSPIASLLGGIGGYALFAWAAFKGAGLISAGVRALGTGVADLGAKMEASAVKSTVASAGVKTFAASTATAATGVGLAASSIAGPLGWALIGGITLWSLFSGGADDSATSTDKMKQATDDLTSALAASHGAIDQNVTDHIKGQDAFKEAAGSLKTLGISQSDFLDAITKGGPALDALKKRLIAIVEAQHIIQSSGDPGYTSSSGAADDYTQLGETAQTVIKDLDALSGSFGDASKSQKDNAVATNDANVALLGSATYQKAAADAAKGLGLGLNDVNLGFLSVMNSGKAAADNLGDITEQTFRMDDSITAAGQSITDHFAQADRAVGQAKRSVSDAAHSFQQSSNSVQGAEHSAAAAARALVQANQAVQDAQHGVTTAQEALARAQGDERTAQAGLHTARQQAIQDLKDLQAQVEGQAISEEQAQLRLFDAQQAATTAGIKTPQDAHKLATATVTATNEDQIRAALELLQAQSDLSAATDKGKDLRTQLNTAEKAGVEGSKVYKDAQAALASAHKQTTDAAYALTQAQRGLERAQQQVTDAAYQQAQAHKAVSDAEYQRTQSAQRLNEAEKALTDAQGKASHSLDQHTAAGRANLKMVYDLWDTISQTGLPAQEKYKRLIDQVATSFGISKEAAQKYLTSVNRIPKDYKYGITAVAGVDWNSYEHTFAKATAKIRDVGGFASGGLVTGPGGPKDDKILTRLSNNEFVVNANATAKNLDLLTAINSGSIPGFADGGLVNFMTGLGMGMAGASYTSNANAAKTMGFPHPKAFPAYVPEAFGEVGAVSASVSGVRGDRAANRAIVMSTFASMFGWKSAAEQRAIDYLLMRESGYNNVAQNPTSTAFGMFQFLNSTWGGYGVAKTADPKLQAVAGGRYVRARYGDPIGASAHEVAYNWYDQGGYLQSGQFGYNGSGKPEMVLDPAMTRLMEDLSQRMYGGGKANSHGIATPTTVVHSTTDARTIHQTFELHVHDTNRSVNLQAQFRQMMESASLEAGL